MEPISRLSAFYKVIEEDLLIGMEHIGLYMALLQQWTTNGCQEPFSVSRSRTMRLARIHGKATYHKYIKELVEYGYIEYIPSYNPIKKSLHHINSD